MYAPFLHDVVYLYAVIVDEMIGLHPHFGLVAATANRAASQRTSLVDEMIQLGLDYRNGTDVMHRAKNFQFIGNNATVFQRRFLGSGGPRPH